jgi:hypothetical protein
MGDNMKSVYEKNLLLIFILLACCTVVLPVSVGAQTPHSNPGQSQQEEQNCDSAQGYITGFDHGYKYGLAHGYDDGLNRHSGFDRVKNAEKAVSYTAEDYPKTDYYKGIFDGWVDGFAAGYAQAWVVGMGYAKATPESLAHIKAVRDEVLNTAQPTGQPTPA